MVEAPAALLEDLRAALGEGAVKARYIDRISRASDASFYRLIPLVVVEPEREAQVAALLQVSRKHRVPVTFRAGGTSLSGQSVTDGVLACLANRWRRAEVRDGHVLVCGPGLRGGEANALLARYGRKIGPDPSSIDAAMLGGIVANNASGMCCGVASNAYHTLHSLRFVLPSGTIVDSGEADADARLLEAEPTLARGLADLRDRARGDAALTARIRDGFQLKNTMGYALNALLDHDTPVQILARLLVGSEGTLAFLSEIRLNTVPVAPHAATALLLYPDLAGAVGAVPAWAALGASAVEFLDRTSLRTMAGLEVLPDEGALAPGTAALLVELQAETPPLLDVLVGRATKLIQTQGLLRGARFTRVAAERAELWRLRKGLFPAVGARKASGHTVVIEDVAFPLEKLAEALVALRALLDASGYEDAVIFGHARDGNCHFVLEQAFDTPARIDAYARFIDDLVALVLRFEGTLKAEHGTGRNMAPFVEAQWGAEATALMWDLKALVDPDGLLNPGVVLSRRPKTHLEHLKPLPTVDPEVDACIECGFCERVCPSRALTLTPRQRIVVRRELARLGPGQGADALAADCAYDLLDTCAGDGLCATACPVHLDTGRLVKRLRAEAGGAPGLAFAARHYGAVRTGAAMAVRAGHRAAGLLGEGAVNGLISAARATTGAQIPGWSEHLHHPAGVPAARPGDGGVLFPSCIGCIAGKPAGQASPAEALAHLSARAGRALRVPEGTGSHCCGLLFDSKGSPEGRSRAASALVRALWGWSDQGRLHVVVDVSSCAHALLESGPVLGAEEAGWLNGMRITDSVGWLAELLPDLKLRKVRKKVVLHPTCSTRHMGGVEGMIAVASALADEVLVPEGSSCCGMAGDRGLIFPELPASALREEAEIVAGAGADGHYSCSPFCEAGLARATGVGWGPLVLLVVEGAG